jgi:CRISPR/Cas system-associated exonuclease Cas4 (RecB family)
MTQQFDFTPILGWSVSRFDKFLSCRRQYFYDYYLKYDRDHPTQKIRNLKRLTSVPLEKGNIVHHVIGVFLRRLLASEEPIDVRRFMDYAERTAEEQCNSKSFAEVYYGETENIDASGFFDEIRVALESFLNSDRYKWITKEAIDVKKDWVIEPRGYGETRLNGMKAYCKVDFLFPVGEDIYVIDWKTGKRYEQKHRKQLLGYTAAVSSDYSKDPTRIIPIIAYLQPSYEEIQMEFNEFDVQDFMTRMEKETEEMYSFCKNVEENIPKEKEEFKKTANTAVCGHCNYRELCGRAGEHRE